MIRDVLWSDMLDADDHEAIAQSINMREGVGTTCTEHIKELMQDEIVDAPDREMIMITDNMKIVY